MTARKKALRLEAYQERVRAGLAQVVPQWVDAARRKLETLTKAAKNPEISDEEFLRLIEAAVIEMPALMAELDGDALARYLERAMGGAAAMGIEATISAYEEAEKTQDGKTQDTREEA
jgi:hypothetical protein